MKESITASSSASQTQRISDKDPYLERIHQEITTKPYLVGLETPEGFYKRISDELLEPLKKGQLANPLHAAIDVAAEIVVAQILQNIETPEEKHAAVTKLVFVHGRFGIGPKRELSAISYAAINFKNPMSSKILKILLDVLTPEQKQKEILTLDGHERSLIHKVLDSVYDSSPSLKVLLHALSTLGQAAVLTPDRNGVTPLHKAAEGSCEQVVCTILEVFPTPEQKQKALLTLNRMGRTPLREALHNKAPVLKTLLDVFTPETTKQEIILKSDNDNRTLVHYAAGIYGDEESGKLKVLLNTLTAEQKQQIVMSVDKNGVIPLHIAASLKHDVRRERIKILLEVLPTLALKEKAILSPNIHHETPLEAAIITDVDLYNGYDNSDALKWREKKEVLQTLINVLSPQAIVDHFIIPFMQKKFEYPEIAPCTRKNLGFTARQVIESIPEDKLCKSLENNDCLAHALLAHDELTKELYQLYPKFRKPRITARIISNPEPKQAQENSVTDVEDSLPATNVYRPSAMVTAVIRAPAAAFLPLPVITAVAGLPLPAFDPGPAILNQSPQFGFFGGSLNDQKIQTKRRAKRAPATSTITPNLDQEQNNIESSSIKKPGAASQ